MTLLHPIKRFMGREREPLRNCTWVRGIIREDSVPLLCYILQYVIEVMLGKCGPVHLKS